MRTQNGVRRIVLTYTYTSVGEYVVTLRVEIDGNYNFANTFTRRIQIMNPKTPSPSTHSQSLLHDKGRNKLWSVNPDNNTVVVVDLNTLVRSNEIHVGESIPVPLLKTARAIYGSVIKTVLASLSLM